MKEETSILDPESYFREMGGMHDARVETIDLFLGASEVAIHVDDVNAAFVGLPGYRGKQSALVILGNVVDVMFAMAPLTESVGIYCVDVTPENDGGEPGFIFTFNFSPGGTLKVKGRSLRLELRN
jgi:hypothetical protein